MTADLIDFLRARLDEDEQAARGATDGPWTPWRKASLHGLGDLIHGVLTPGQGPGSRASIVTASWLDAEHIARHDPARVLAEVEAKREALRRYDWLADVASDDTTGSTAIEAIVRAMAAVYADHPNYRPEWAPEA